MQKQSLSPYIASKRQVYCTTFVDPRNGIRKNKSLRTRDMTEAKQICVDIERILNTPAYQNIENEDVRLFHPTAIEIFFGEALEAASPLISVSPGNTLIRGHGRKMGGVFYSTKYKEAQERVVLLERERSRLLHDNEVLKEENLELRRQLGNHVTTPINEAISKWLAGEYKSRARHTQQEAKHVLESLCKHIGESKFVSKISSAQIDEWLLNCRNEKTGGTISQVTKKRYRAYTSSFFTWAVRTYDLAENPVKKTSPIHGIARSRAPINAIKCPDTLKKFINAFAPWPYWQTWVAFACLAGPRLAEQRFLRVCDVYLDEGYVEFVSRLKENVNKTGQSRRVGIERTLLLSILKKHLKNQVSEFVFPQTSAQSIHRKVLKDVWSGEHTIYAAFRPIADAAAKQSKLVGPFWEYTQRDFRHCFGTALGHSGFSLFEIAKLMGNSESVAQTYYVASLQPGARWPFKWS